MSRVKAIKSPPEDVPEGYLAAMGRNERTIEQTMEVLPKGTRRLAAQLRTSATFDALWTILTTYDQLSNFIPNLSSSKLLSRQANRVELRQVGSQVFLGFTFTAEVLLELFEEKDKGLLKFNLIEGDFRRFEGSWLITPSQNKCDTSLVYELTVQGALGMPVGLIENRLRQDLANNLLAVERAALGTA